MAEDALTRPTPAPSPADLLREIAVEIHERHPHLPPAALRSAVYAQFNEESAAAGGRLRIPSRRERRQKGR